MFWTAIAVVGALLTTPAEQLLAARARAYDANFRNDAGMLRQAADELRRLENDRDVGAMALYYAAWTEWALAASELQAGRTADAIGAAERAVAHARRAFAAQPNDVEIVTMLTNALISVAVLDRARLPELAPEITQLRRRALALAPTNPRVVMMDAGMIYNAPPERGGSHEKGLTRWLEAIALLEQEIRQPEPDRLRPRWGHALAYGWLADLYLAASPPQHEKAREAANTALKLRPDFWYVKEQVLPRLAK